jgi:hypothetical protein
VAEIDFTAAWMALRADLVHGQRSRGRDQLLARMAEIEVDHAIPDSQQGFDERPAPTRTPTAQASVRAA